MTETHTPDDAPAKTTIPVPRSEPDTEKIDPDAVPEPAAPSKTGQELAAEAEIRRIRATAGRMEPVKARTTKPRHKRRPHWLLLLLPWLAGIVVAFIIGWLIWSLVDDGGDMKDNGYTVAPNQPDKLEEAARHLKPLDDLERNDRVFYVNKICAFQRWDGDNHDKATVRCDQGVKKLQSVETIKLVPVEEKPAAALT